MDGNMKHIKKYRGFKNWLSEAKGYYIKVSIRDSKKALAILDEMYGKKFDISGSDTYYFKNEDMAHDAKYDLAARDIQVTDTNIEESALNEAQTDINSLASELGTKFPKMSKMGNWVREVEVEDDYDGGVNIKVSGLAGDSTPKKEVNNVLKKLGWSTKYKGRENYSTSYGSGNGHTYTWQLKGAKDTDLTPDWGNDWDIDESAITERNAFLGARAKAIEEDLEEFEFNGKTYPVTIKNVDEGAPNYDDANFNLDKIFGDDQESIEIFQDIEDNGTVADMIDYIDEWGDEEMLQRYGIRSDAHVKKLAKKIMESKVTEDRFGHPITAQGNQAYVQMGKLLDMLSGNESKVVEKAYKKFWDILKPAMEAEEQKSK